MKKRTRILSILLSIVMISSMIVLPDVALATADQAEGYSNARADITYEYLGTTSNANVEEMEETDLPSGTLEDFQWKQGDYIWIGVSFEHMDRQADMFSAKGLTTLTLSLAYDTQYLSWTLGDAAQAFQLLDGQFDYYRNNTDPTATYPYKTGSKRNTASYTTTASNATLSSFEGTDEWSKFYPITLTNKDDTANIGVARQVINRDNATTVTDMMFYGSYLKADKTMVAIFPLKMISAEAPNPGTKIVEGVFSSSPFVLNVGNDSYNFTYDHNEDINNNLYNRFNIVNNVVDLFPTTYSIEFYNSYDPDTKTYGTQLTGKDITGIKEGDTVAATTDAIMPADSDFTNDDTTKYLSKPLKYIGADGKAHDFDPNTTVLNSTLFASDAADKTTLKVFAEWADGHTVTFHSKYPDNTDTTVTRTVAPNSPSAINKTDAPTVGTADTDFIVPDGYVFDGWYTAENGQGTKIVFAEEGVDGTDVSAINDVYAKWQPMYTVKFYKQEGDSTEIKTALQFDPSDTVLNRTITSSVLPNDSERGTIDGKRFNGWYYKVGNSGTETKFEDSTNLVVSDNVVIYGKWVDVVTVSFYDSKTDSVAASSWEVDKGKTVADLTASQTIPTKTDNDSTHKYFIGWKNKTDDSAVDFTDSTYTFNADLEVYADYGDYYQIKYYNNTKDSAPTQFGDTVYVNPHSNSNNPVVTSSDIPSTPPTSTDPDKGFSKWVYYVSGNKKDFGAGVSVTGNIDVYPEWADLISINFDYNGGTLDSASDKTLKIKPSTSISSADNGSLLAPVPTRTYGGHSYILKGWAASANSQTPDYTTNTINSTVFAAGTKLYAVWAVDPNSDPNNLATLTFDSVGGSPVSPITVYKGDTITAAQMPADPTKTSATNKPYTFDGWYEEATLTNTNKFTTPITLNADDTAYAHWKYEQSDAITISFNDDGATTAVSPKSIQIAPGDSIGDAWPTDPAKTDNTFGGWYTDTSDESTKKDKNSTFAQSTTLNAKWVADITVIYDTNGGNADGPGTVKKPAGDAYVDPTETPTKNGVNGHPKYTFLGWNTKKNGSGTYIKAGNKTGSSDPLKYSDLVTGGASSVTLYAQWGAYNPETGADEKQQAVTVTFDGNGTTQKPVTKEANPKNKYPQLGDSIGEGNMPNNPERTGYTFKEWNTKADGTGTNVTGTTVFDENLDGVTAAGNGTYTSTVYAQWTPTDPSTAITVKFNKNTDGTGKAADDVVTLSIVSGDSLGAAMPADPTNGTYAFDGWYAGSVTDDKVTTSGDALTSSTPISATTTYYAKWTKMLVARMKTNTAVYTGSQIKPLFDIYEITWPDQDNPYVLGDRIATDIDPTTNPDYTITYSGESTTGVKDVGSYGFSVQLANTSALAIAGATIAQTDYEDNNKNRTLNFTVTPKLLTVKVNPDTQIQKAGATVQPAAVKIEGIVGTDAEANVIEKKYYKWTPADGSDTTIEQSELAVEATPTAIAKYVLQVTVKSDNKNYKIDSVVSSKDGTPVLLYGKTATQTYPAFNILNTDGNIVPGTNIVYVIQANDPSASDICVKAVDKKTSNETDASLKESDYKTDTSFEGGEEPDNTTYYTWVPKETGSVKLIITPTESNTSDIKATLDGQDYTAASNKDGTYTVEVPITKSGKDVSEITITMSVGEEPDQVTMNYTVNVRQLVDATIVLEYGNSPAGLIKRDTVTFLDDNARDAAIQAFDTSDAVNKKYSAGQVPVGGESSLTYVASAWRDYKDSDGNVINYDLDPYALFAYEASTFKVPSYVVYDELGDKIENANANISFVVKKQKSPGVSDYKSDSGVEDYSPSLVTNTTDTYSLQGVMVRMDVYKMEYSYNYTTMTGSSELITNTRPIIILGRRGDVFLNTTPTINDGDVDHLKSHTQDVNSGNGLVAFRCMDLVMNTTPTINDSDVDRLTNYTQDYNAASQIQYYKALD